MTKKGRLLRFMTRANKGHDNPLWAAKQYWKNQELFKYPVRYMFSLRVVANGYDGRGIQRLAK